MAAKNIRRNRYRYFLVLNRAAATGDYTDTARPNHLVQEVVDNSVDEAIAGHAREIEVALNKDGSVEVM